MKKQILLWSLLLSCTLPILASKFEVNGIVYNKLSGDSVEVTFREYDGVNYNRWDYYSGNIVIPENVTYEGVSYKVTKIANHAFEGCDGLTSIIIGENVIKIGAVAFYGCESLTSITINKNITSIGSAAFGNCNSITSVIWNAKHCADFQHLNTPFYNDESYDHYPRFDASSQITSFTFGNEVEHIPAYLCSCMSIASITIPNSVTAIGDGAFCYSDLTSITIPNSVTTIGGAAFGGCSKLTSITIPDSVTTIRYNTFNGCRSLSSLTIPNGITTIEDRAFYQSGLKSIIIPNRVDTIGDYAFTECSNLTLVTIGENVKSLGALIFLNCNSLTSVIWNAKNLVDYHSYNASSSDSPFYHYAYQDPSNFDLRSQITSFEFGDSVQHIPAYLCNGMKNLTSITIPQNVTSIGAQAFAHSGLKSVIWNAKKCNDANGNNIFRQEVDYETIYSNSYRNNSIQTFIFGNDVEYIPDFLCAGLRGMTSLTISNSVKEIGWYAFDRCSKLENVVIPNSVTTLGGVAFSECSNLTSVILPNSVTSIGYGAFYLCDNLPSPVYNDKIFAFLPITYQGEYTIPDGIRTIAGAAFWGCTITSITIPQTVTFIDDGAFEECSNLEKLTCLADMPPSVHENAFCKVYNSKYHYSSVILHVPSKSVTTYKETEYWKKFYKIEAINTTDVENILTDQTHTRKVLENGTIYILRGDEKYTIDGRKVM